MPVDVVTARTVALADVDGDGDLDLVLESFRKQSLLYLNDGRGTYTDATAPRMPVGGDISLAVALGDVDRGR